MTAMPQTCRHSLMNRLSSCTTPFLFRASLSLSDHGYFFAFCQELGLNLGYRRAQTGIRRHLQGVVYMSHPRDIDCSRAISAILVILSDLLTCCMLISPCPSQLQFVTCFVSVTCLKGRCPTPRLKTLWLCLTRGFSHTEKVSFQGDGHTVPIVTRRVYANLVETALIEPVARGVTGSLFPVRDRRGGGECQAAFQGHVTEEHVGHCR